MTIHWPKMAELEQLHATFHAAISVHDPVNGGSPAVITQRVRDILAIFIQDAELIVVSTAAAAGNYIGNGDPDDSASCPLPSGDTSATGQQGTLCTFFKYVAGGGYRRPISLCRFPQRSKRSVSL